MRPNQKWIFKLLPLAFYVFITGLMLYPVSLNPASFVLGRPYDDVFEALGYLGWYKKAIFDLNTSPLFQPDIFYPDGWQLIFAPIPPIFPALASPFTAIFGPVTTYNLIVMGTTVIAAFGSYKITRLIGGNIWGAMFAGFLYAYYPNRQVYMNGFFNFMIASVWLPWMLYALLKGYKNPEKRTKWLALTGLFYSLSIAAAYQYVYISSITLLIFGTILLFSEIRRNWKAWKRPLFFMLLTIFFIAGPILLIGYIAQQQSHVVREYSIQNLIATSVSLERFFVPSARNPLFRVISTEIFPIREGEDSVITFGFITLILVIIWLFLRKPHERIEKSFFVLALISLLLMVGPFLKWQGEPITFASPVIPGIGDIVPEIVVAQGFRVPMPALLIYKFIPPLRTFHHFGRLGMVAALSFGVLAGLGLTFIIERMGKIIKVIVLIGVFALLIFELNMQPQSDVTAISSMQREVDQWLAFQETQNVIMEYPLWLTLKPTSLYFYLTHGQKMIHGYSPVIPPTFSTVRPTLEKWPEPEAISIMKDLSVDYVLVHTNAASEERFIDETLQLITANNDLEFITRLERDVSLDANQTFLFGQIEPKQYSAPITYVFAIRN